MNGRGEPLNQLRRDAVLVAYRAFSDVAGKGAFLVLTLVAARRLSQNAFGLFSVGTTVGWIAAVATDFGVQLHVARRVAQQPSRADALLRRWLRFRVWTALAAVALVGIGLIVARASADFSRAIFLFTVVYVVSGLIEFLHYFYRGMSRTDVESTLTLWQRLVTLILAVAVLWWRPDVTALAVAMLVPAVGTLLYSARRATRVAAHATEAHSTEAHARHRSEPPPPVEPPDPIQLEPVESARSAMRAVAPIGAGIVLSALYFRIDVLLIDAWAGTAAVALYNAVFRLVEALRLFPAAVLAVALPVLFRATTGRPLVNLSALLTGGAAMMTIVLWLAAGWMVPMLYGPGYAGAVPAFRVLLLSFPLMSLNYALTHQLVGWDRHRAYAVICAAALVFNVALNARLIPASGIVGAAWTTVFTEVVVTAGCLFALRTRRGANQSTLPKVANPTNLSSPVALS